MKYFKHIFSLSFLLAILVSGFSQSKESKKKTEMKARLKQHISYLASDELEGRQTGSPGEMKSARYIANQFKKNGLKLLGKEGLQEFTMVQFRIADESTRFLTIGPNLAVPPVERELHSEFYPLSLTVDYDSVEAEIIDVGYGIVAEKLDKNEYEGLDVEGKIAVMRLGYFGMEDNPHSELANYSDINTKVITAIDHGAVGVIFIKNNIEDKNPSGKLSRSVKPSNIPVFFFNTEKPLPLGFKAKMVSKVVSPTAIGHNVVAFKNNHRKKTVIICAHHDHIGYNEYENSRYRGPSAIHNGADDNASGVAAMIELSKQLQKWGLRKNNYLFIAFSGEELGLLGSKYFAHNPLIPLDEINYVINIDMLGRIDSTKKTLTINGVGTSPTWEKIIAKLENDTSILKVSTTKSGLGPSDHASFYLENIPVLHFFSGQHRDYHTPDDDEYKINYDGMFESIEVLKEMVCRVGCKKLKFQKTKDASPGRTRFKVTLGVMPDYSFSGKGMRIDGVTEGKPASVAGLLRNDVVIKMGDFEVNDMMGYMSALGKFNKGDTTDVIIKRADKEITVQVTF